MPIFTDPFGFFGGRCRSDDDGGNDLDAACDLTPTGWSLAEVGSTGTDDYGYGSGGVSDSGENFVLNGLGSSFTPPSFSYTGYLRLVVTCSDGSKQTIDSWTTINGGPARSFPNTYPNPCCNGKNGDNTNIIIAGAVSGYVVVPKGVSKAQLITRILQAAKKFGEGKSLAYYTELVKGFQRAGAVIDINGVCTSIPEGKFFNPGVVRGTELTVGQKAIIESVKRYVLEFGGRIVVPPVPVTPPPVFPFIMPLPLMPNWDPILNRFLRPGEPRRACNDPGTLNPGVGTAILASNNGRTSINLANIYGPSMSPSLTSNNHVINAFGGSPPTSFPVALTAKKG